MTATKNGLSTEFISHPGDTLLELLEQYGISQKELSLKTQTSEKHINEIIKGKKGITVSFAKKLENVFKPSATFWINRQTIYDEEIESIRIVENISDEEKNTTKRFPLKELVRFGYIQEGNGEIENVLILRKYCGVSNLLSVNEVMNHLLYGTAFKKDATSHSDDPYVLYSWLRMCQLETESIYNPNVFDSKKLRTKLHDIKRLSKLDDINKVYEIVVAILYDCGINYRMVRNFKSLSVQGYIKNVNNNVSLCTTLKYHREDVFWFTLFHEIGHLLSIRNTRAFVDERNDEDDANSFARDYLINHDSYRRLLNHISERSIIECAKENDICPAIVVGRLANEQKIRYNQFNYLVRKIEWSD